MANKKYPQEFRDSTVQLALNSNKVIISIVICLDLLQMRTDLKYTIRQIINKVLA